MKFASPFLTDAFSETNAPGESTSGSLRNWTTDTVRLDLQMIICIVYVQDANNENQTRSPERL